MKECNTCGTLKPLSEFHKKPRAKDGHRNNCKVCKNSADSRVRKLRLTDPDNLEKERARLKTLYGSRSEEEKERIRIRDIENSKKRRQAESEAFFKEHGCTRKEFKRRQDEQEFIKIGKTLNCDKYDYSEVYYQGVYPEVTIFCNKHQHRFQQSPKYHKKGSGCPLCAKEQCGLYHKKSQEQFIQEAEELCGEKYTFEHVVYVNNHTSVDVNCTIHGIFPIRPANLLSGKGCPSCADYGYNKSRPGTLYVLACDDIVKVGITNRTSGARVKDISKSSGKSFKVLWDFWFADGKIPANLESSLLSELRESFEQPTEVFDGSTECFHGIDTEWLLLKINEQIKATLHGNY